MVTSEVPLPLHYSQHGEKQVCGIGPSKGNLGLFFSRRSPQHTATACSSQGNAGQRKEQCKEVRVVPCWHSSC